MHALQVLQKTLIIACPQMHKTRREAVKAAVLSVITGQELSVTGIGRNMQSSAKEKHCIKRSDRLVSNGHLSVERASIYELCSQLIIGRCKRPVILVDWSDLDPYKGHFLLRASTPVGGRSLTVYEEVHTVETKEKRRTHGYFLQRLKGLLPADCRPIIVTDAGFRAPWFLQVESLNWDWVGRIRNRTMLSLNEEDWLPCKTLYEDATTRPKSLGTVALRRSNPMTCQAVIYKAKVKGRHQLNCDGKRSMRHQSEQHAQRGKEPWLLGTSLPVTSKLAKKVVGLYSSRMEIEEAFRDLKSRRYGIGYEYNRTRDLERLQILLLLGSLALMVIWLMGKATELTQQHRQYQANSIRDRKVLSTIFLGRKVLNDKRVVLSASDIEMAWAYLKQKVQEYEY